MKKWITGICMLLVCFQISAQDQQQQLILYWENAKEAYAEKRMEDVRTNLEEVVKISPMFNAYKMLGDLYKSLGEIDQIKQTMDYYKDFIKNNPEDENVKVAEREFLKLEKSYNDLLEKKQLIDRLQGVWVSDLRTKELSAPAWVVEISKEYNPEEVVPYKFEISKRSPEIKKHIMFGQSDSILYVRNIQLYTDSVLKMVFTSQRLQVPPVEVIEAGMELTNAIYEKSVEGIFTSNMTTVEKGATTLGAEILRYFILGGLTGIQAKKKVAVVEMDFNMKQKGVLEGILTEIHLVADHTGKVDTVLKNESHLSLIRIPEDAVSSFLYQENGELYTLASGALSNRELIQSGYFRAMTQYKNRKFMRNWGIALLMLGGGTWMGLASAEEKPNIAGIVTGGLAMAGGIVLWNFYPHRKPVRVYNENIYQNLEKQRQVNSSSKLKAQFIIRPAFSCIGPSISVNF